TAVRCQLCALQVGSALRMSLPPPSPESTCLITGASSGIGTELARALASRGHGVTLVARRKERLDQLVEELSREQGIQARAIDCDLSDLNERDRLEAELTAAQLHVEILCNNAGFGTAGPFTSLD